ncbi:MAG: SnoaL-like domain-containing protein [Gammaproteobacteria bacterium]|nr:SnoaL-like domain-containing protein [Gammaproteobacteria bacterium]
MRTNKKYIFNFLILLALFTAAIANADDVADVKAVIHKYINSETLDLTEQAKLMASDRTYIASGMRYTNNAKSMAIQTAGNNVLKKARPDVERIATVEDIMVRVNGNSAVSSFYRVINTTNSVESVRAGQGAMTSFYQTGTMVLFKIKGDWKIVHTHLSATK